MIKVILWDVDGTLLDFKTAEKAAIRALFAEFAIGECTDEMLADYSAINRKYWQRLERGEITKPQVLEGRFEEFFGKEGIRTDIIKEFNARYQLALGDTIAFRDDCLEIIRQLSGKVRQYVVTNGTLVAQEKKLRLSGLEDLMDGRFVSEEVGVEKPDIRFFNKVFEVIGDIDREQVLIVGDSLTSDIKGGMNAGIKTCLYAPEGMQVPDQYRVDYQIRDLHEVFAILDRD